MKAILMIAAFAVFAPGTAYAQSAAAKPAQNAAPDAPSSFESANKADITELINSYFHAFTIKDYAAFRSYFQVPFLNFGGTVNVTTSLDDVAARYESIRDGLESTDYAVSKAQQLIITPLSPNAALVDVHWRRDKKDGSLFGEGAEILMVSKSSGSWKICGNIGQQLSQYAKTF